MSIRVPLVVLVTACAGTLSSASLFETGSGKGLGKGPPWRGPIAPEAANEAFATANGCSMCHSHSDRAAAMTSASGDDVSPYGLWQATMMANSFRDPYWRAQVSKEVAADPDRGAAIESLCLTCHGPMAHHSARLGGIEPPRIADAANDPLARDGVSCTVCHQAKPETLGTEASFGGRLDIGLDRKIYGPYEDPAFGPMRMHSGYTPTHGEHVKDSALCGSCHTLVTHHRGVAFPEQTPYLEWRNSIFSDESGATETSRSCQQCHMPNLGDMRIARNPGGRDFNIALRPDYAAHTFLGGNAFMLDLFRANRDELDVRASDEALLRAARATRRQLADSTTRVTISEPVRDDGTLTFSVAIENLTGHKFPTGYPARRAWLEVDVRVGGESVFRSGASDERGRLIGIEDERSIPHPDVITSPGQVAVYEAIPVDPDGAPTTYLTRMVGYRKDTRLLPKGYRDDGPHADSTAQKGTGDDPDFRAGGDIVHFRVPLAADAGKAQVVAWMRYQPVPPSWVDPLREVDTEEARRFVRMYDAASPVPETAGLAARTEP